MPQTPAEADPLDLTAEQVAAIVPTAIAAAETAQQALAAAEADPTAVTPQQLAELRQAADHATLMIPAAERQFNEISAARHAAYRAAQVERMLSEAPDALANAADITSKATAAQDALSALVTAIRGHNDTVTYWAKQVPHDGAEDGLTSTARDRVTVGGRAYAHLNAGRISLSLLHRALADVPEDTRGTDLRPGDDPYGLLRGRENGTLPIGATRDADLRDVIGRAA